MTNQIKLSKVKYIPDELELGVLYYSKKYGIASHLCPCGCGNEIVTPLDKFEWKLNVKKGKLSLFPSIGNWQLDCKSHYWIKKGVIVWANDWSDLEIELGQESEKANREKYFKNRNKSFFNIRRFF